MADLEKRLSASVGMGAIHGDRFERNVMESQVREAITELRSLRAQLAEREREWRPIETAPKDGTYILVSNPSAGASWVAKYMEQYVSGFRPSNPWQTLLLNHRHFKNRSASMRPTHWMPLPEPPTTEADK